MTSADDQRAKVQALFIQHHLALRAFLVTLVADFSLVDDIVQESFLTVTRKADSFTLGTNFKAWLWTIGRLKMHELLRARKRQGVLAEDVLDMLCGHDDAIDWDAIDRRIDLIGTCVEQLAPKARLAVELRYQRALKPPEIARVMGWTVNAVNVALSRARRAIRECVEVRLVEAST
jgi:RNA polymerase sigma-70 factor (ECF subfamily)